MNLVEVATPADMEGLLELVGDFHDAVVREAQILNRAFVAADLSMSMGMLRSAANARAAAVESAHGGGTLLRRRPQSRRGEP